MMIKTPSALTTYYTTRTVSAFAFTLIITYEFVLHTLGAQLTPAQLIAVGVVLESMTILFEVPTGVIADAYSRRLSIIVGVALMGCGFLFEGVWMTFASILIAQVLWGLGFTFVSGATTAWITDEIGEEAARDALMRGAQLAQGARLLAVVIATALANVRLQLPILVGAIILLGLALFLWMFMGEEGFRPKRTAQPILQQMLVPFQTSVQLVRVRPMLITILLLGLIIGIHAGSFDRLHTPYLNETFTFPETPYWNAIAWFGILRGITAIISLLGTELARRRQLQTDRDMMRLLSLLYSGMIVTTLLFALTNNFTLAAIGYCVGQSFRNVSRPILAIWVNKNAPSEVRATVISMYWQSNALGQVVGTPPIGWLATRLSLRIALTVATAIYTLTLPLLRWQQNTATHE